jgi:xylulokinase
VPYVIGVDVGSQGVKAVLLDPDGHCVRSAARPLSMSHPAAGWAEQDPAAWEQALADVVGELMAAGVARPGELATLALACQVDGVVAVDAALNPLRNAIIWLDRRAEQQTARMQAALGRDAIFSRTGLVPDASHTAPKMMWLREHEPDLTANAAALVPVGAYLVGRLTGELVQDPANASSTLLFDLAKGTWSEELCAAAGIDTALLPAVRPAHEVAETLTPASAARLGLTAKTQICVGTGDEHAASLAAGAVRPGIVADVTGTAEPVTVAAPDPVLDPEQLVETHAHAAPGMYLVENPGFVSGGSTLWLAGEVLGRVQADVFTLAAGAPAGSDGVLFLPALSGAMAPRWSSGMRGAFAGLAMNTGAAHLARAVLEGCAYALRDIVDRLDALGLADADPHDADSRDGEVRVVGGGGRSRLWCQIKADVLGRPVRRVLAEEATALGAALLAGVAAGTFTDLAEAVGRTVELDPEPIVPDPAAVAVYAETYPRYRRLFDHVEEALT